MSWDWGSFLVGMMAGWTLLFAHVLLMVESMRREEER